VEAGHLFGSSLPSTPFQSSRTEFLDANMVLAKFLFFSLLIVVIPLSTLYSGSQGAFDALLQPFFGATVLEANRLVLAGLLAVAAVNLVLVLFVISAWQEKVPPSNHKQD
jgi:hypothetical protein